MKRTFLVFTVLVFFALCFAGSREAQTVVRRPITASATPTPSPEDAFTQADGTPLSANWTTVSSGQWEILGNAAHADDNFDIYFLSYWDTFSFANNQFAEATVDLGAGGAYVGPAVRIQSAAFNGYICIASSTAGTTLQRLDSGSATTLNSSGSAPSVGQVLRLEITGNSLSCTWPGGGSIGATDSTYTSGSAGISAFRGNGAPVILHWLGGDL